MATLSEALAEVYASNPKDDFALNTLEIRHPTFVDDDGNPAPIRVVADHVPLTATLEADAPLNPGAPVEFSAMAFGFKLPTTEEGQAPQLDVTLDGVSRDVVAHLENAVAQTAQIEVTYRRFLAANPAAGPQDGEPLTLYASKANATLTQAKMSATLTDIHNKAYPSRTYTATEFPGLNR
ncbi:DUF1833 domain-containing protein [Paraburkholderia sp. Cy-641]|uniref:DUF1833 family protein n=1 Tax=Paraburkholderia sp. Cy-641 TaxID=2608337 RepID=UPI0014242E12|nr:DUF1833 family protein [Paraburkholderia sp. Cy-641]NIF80133.1 DUF1833 domain-containing protein [Paraburkholderia sp. Cy-641]